ncbi:MAG: hypothetical protein KKB79_01515 [Nanoarchaeota archaeon]|nr:hypothetical protein [Nanoarchaeota archaeon]
MDKDIPTRQKEHHQAIWIITAFAIIFIILFWAIPAVSNELTFNKKIGYTIGFLVGIPLMWLFFYKQKRMDEGKDQGKNLTTKAFKVANMSSGIGYGISTIRGIIASIVLILGGIFILIAGEGIRWAGAVFIILGLLMIIYVKNSITLAKRRMKGRAY